MSNNTEQALQQQLAQYQRELKDWEDQRFTRNDGSPAQDRRFEERGERLQEQVYRLSRELEALSTRGA